MVSLMAAAGLLGAMAAFPVTAADESTRISFLGLDHGDATLVRVAGGATLLFGGGTRAEGPRVVKWLRGQGVRSVDAVLVQTWKESHFGGLASVLKSLPVRQFLYNPIETPNVHARALKAQADGLRSTARMSFGPAILNDRQTLNYNPFCQITVVGPTGTMQRRFRTDPNCSLVMEVRHGPGAFLNLGDVGPAHQKVLWSEARPLPWGQVLRVGQDGAAGSVTAASLKALKTRVAVIPVARRTGRKPAAETLAALKRAGVRVYRTDLMGTVTVTTDGSKVSVQTGGPRP